MIISNYYNIIKKRIKRIVLKEKSGIDVEIYGNNIQKLNIMRKKNGRVYSKAGTIYWRGELNKKKVKIFECNTEEQAALIQILSEEKYLKNYLPTCYLRIKNILIVEWVEGKQLNWRKIYKDKDVIKEVVAIQNYFHNFYIGNLQGKKVFDYKYYLKKRLLKFTSILPIQDFIERSFTIIEDYDHNENQRISHPDLTAGNLIIEPITKSIKIIDNELLTQNSYNLIDLFNTVYSFGTYTNKLLYPYLDQYRNKGGNIEEIRENKEFYESLWYVRLIGSLLENGNIKGAYKYYKQLEFKQNVHPIFDYIKEKL